MGGGRVIKTGPSGGIDERVGGVGAELLRLVRVEVSMNGWGGGRVIKTGLGRGIDERGGGVINTGLSGGIDERS